MNLQTFAYVIAISAFGVVSTVRALSTLAWTMSSEALGYTLFTLLSSGMKVTLPGSRGTMSVSYVFLLLASVDLLWQEAILIGLTSVVLQYTWNAKEKLQLAKFGFNCGNIILSLTAASYAFHWLATWHSIIEVPLRIAVASFVYFCVNTGALALVMALSERKSVLTLWRESLSWSLPHYLAGAVLVAVYVMTKPVVGWQTCAIFVPVLWLMYRTYRLYVTRLETERKAAELKGQFLANMSHEIRTPMNAVFGLTALLLEEKSLSKEHRESVELIRSASNSLLTIIDDILDISALESGKVTIKPQRCDLYVVVNEVHTTLLLGARTKGIAFDFEYVDTVPRWIVADASRIRQVLLNLCGNGIKFTSQGKVTLSVRSTNENRIRCEVIDTGIGISEDKVGALFQPFSQVDSSDSRAFGGSGLGLCISKRLIEAMGGAIGVITEMGRGSTFWFELPLQLADAPTEAEQTSPTEVAPDKPAGTHSAAASSLMPKSADVPGSFAPQSTGVHLPVLVVEDNLLNQRVAVRLLQKLGYSTEVAGDGRIGLEKVRQNRYALILMDCQMPNMDGFEATEAIRKSEEDYRTPIVALTAGALRADEARCLEVGMDAFLTKPVDVKLLKATLERFCGAAPPLPRIENAA